MDFPTPPLPCLGRIGHAGVMSQPPDDDGDLQPAEQALAQARADAQAARTQGHSFAVALAATQAGHALLVLGRADEALADFSEASEFVELLRADGQHEHMRLLSMASLSLAPPGENLGDLDTLEAWVRVGQAGAYEQLGRTTDARAAIEAARPFTRGWRRRDLRKALDTISDRLARADGSGPEALAATQRAVRDTRLSDTDRRDARYEQCVLLVDDGRFDEAIRESLMLLRDSDDDPGLQARVRQVLGAALAGTGRDADALMTLTQAFEEFAALGEDRAVALAGPGLAERLTVDGQHARAIEVLRQSVSAARILRARGEVDAGLEADLLGALATALDQAGDRSGAVEVFAESVEAAATAGDDVRLADAQHGEAVSRARSGDADESVEALALLDAARTRYEQAGMADRAAGCLHESAALLGRLGSFEAARGRYESAAETYDAIPEILAGDTAEARGDVDYNLSVLQSIMDGGHAPDDAFRSGGHQMSFGSQPFDSGSSQE